MATITLSKLLTLCLIITIKEPIISSQKWSIDNEKSGSDKLNECLRCKVLTDSFRHWLDRTARGKHEGGDAAWEEAKLKSYSRSEMRLVEIQEGLCSEVKKHKDQCYALAEEAESKLEKWFKEHYDNVDLYNWLCIENLLYCCPPNHYGEVCTPCALDKYNDICGGHGKCDGDGTRKGNGTCICNRGYSGNNCDECAANFYNSMSKCKPCHQACNGCKGDGLNSCIECSIGWSMVSGVCVDLNECLDASNACKASEFCINTKGSYICKNCDRTCSECIGPGPRNCTSCKPDNELWVGTCMTSEHKQILVNNTFKRAVCYIGLWMIVIVILKKSWSIASFVALLVALIIYFYENTFDINLLDLFNNYYH